MKEVNLFIFRLIHKTSVCAFVLATWMGVIFSPALAGADDEDMYDKVILEIADRYEVEPALIKAVIKAESRYDHLAVSYRGARGLMQLMPRTARAFGVKDSFDPHLNIEGGAKYLKWLLDSFDGEMKLAVAAYNAGRRKVLKYKGVPPYKVTRRYVRQVFRYYRRYKAEMKLTAMNNI